MILSDGTWVYLNAESVITYPQKFVGEKREVTLEGEAYFQVTASKERPFVVKTKDMEERKALISYLKERDIAAVFHYVPLHSAPAGLRFGRFHGEDRYTTKESERLLRLPMYYNLSESNQQKVIDAVHGFYHK